MAKIKTYPVTMLIDVSADDSVATGSLNVNGTLKGLVLVAPDMTGATYTFAITDEHGATVFTRASITKNVTTTIWSDKYGGNAEYSPLDTPLMGPLTLTLTSVGNEAADRSYSIYIYYE